MYPFVWVPLESYQSARALPIWQEKVETTAHALAGPLLVSLNKVRKVFAVDSSYR